MRQSDRRGRLRNSILCLPLRNSTWRGSFSSQENLTKPTQLGAKWQSCSHHRRPVIGGRCSSLFSAATAKQPYARRNSNLTTAFVLSNSHSRTGSGASARKQTRL